MTRRLLFALFAVLVALQVFIPPFAGLANNGDFPRVTGWLSIGPKDNGWADNFLYFVSDYIRAPAYFWNSRVYTSELPLAWLGTRFGLDIRCVGLVHALLFLTAFWLALRRLTLPAAVLALLIFTDLSYTAYLNSFYMDTPALLGLLLMAALAEGNEAWFAAAALLFIFSKPQHGLLGAFPAAWLWFRDSRALAALAMAATLLSPFTIPRPLKQQPLFSVIFTKVAHDADDLRELGLPARDLQYIGTHAYSPGTPANDVAWLESFNGQTSYAAVALFYAHHPLRTAAILWRDLTREAPAMRPVNLRNFRRADEGRPAFRYTSWSDFRAFLLRAWPWHIPVWYAAAIWFGVKRRAPFFIGLCGLAICEFCIASLTDGVETYRHLFIFHAITDITICLTFPLRKRIG